MILYLEIFEKNLDFQIKQIEIANKASSSGQKEPIFGDFTKKPLYSY